jgi:hypothetical protein
MKWAKIRLVVTGILFLSWLGWLAYLAINYSQPIVVSRSQIMLVTHPAEAKIFIENGQPKEAQILRILGKTPDQDQILHQEKPIDIKNLVLARLATEKPLVNEQVYLLPLIKHTDGSYELVSAPGSPGMQSSPHRPLVYPFVPKVEKQVRELLR